MRMAIGKRLTSLLTAMTLAGQAGAAQEPATVRPGDGVVNGAFIESYAASFRLVRKTADGKASPYGRWIDTVRFVSRDGRRLLRRVVARYDSTDTMDLWREHLVDPVSLAPVSTWQRIGAGLSQSARFTFVGDSIDVQLHNVPTPGDRAVGRRLREPVFDLALYATLLVSFPLGDGYRARFPIYGPNLDLAWETLTVTGRERVPVEKGEVDAWVVETAGRPWVAWLSREAPYIARIVQRSPDGSEVASIRTAYVKLRG